MTGGEVAADDPLVGRDDEVDRLDQAIERLGEGAQLVEVTGDPGIGKSRLLAELSHRCRLRDLPVLTGRVPPGGSVFPFGVLIDALDDRLRGVRADAWTHPPAREARVLAEIFPSFPYRIRDTPSPHLAVPRYRRFRAIRSMLEVLASTGPLAVILEDLHRADVETIDTVCYLVQSPPQAAILLAFAYRTRQAPPRLRGAATKAGTLLRLPLTPLSPAAVRTVLATCVCDAECDDLYRRSGGNPRHLRALLDAARPSTDEVATFGDSASPDVQTAPEPVDPAERGRMYSAAETVIAAELDELSTQSRLAAAAAAVLAAVFDLAAVAAVAELPEETVRRAIDELATADIVRNVPETTRFRFRHPLVRQVVYHSSQPGWRLGAHARAAAALAGAQHEEIARAPHLALVATPDDDAALRTLRRAATAVERDSPETAARWRQAALRLASVAGSPPTDRHVLLLQVATAYAAAGRPRHARDMLLAALRQPVVIPPADRANLVVCWVRLCRSLGEHGPARKLLAAELAGSSGSSPNPLRVNLLIEAAFLELADGSAPTARTSAATALGLIEAGLPVAAQVDDLSPGVQGIALKVCAWAALAAADGLAGAFDSVAATLTEAVPVLDAMSDAELAAHPDAAYWIGWSELVLERYHDALRHLERVRHARSTQRSPVCGALSAADPLPVCDALLARTWILAITGRHGAAVGTAATAAEVAYRSGSAHLRQRAAIMRCWVALGAAGSRRPGPGAAPLAAGGTPLSAGSPAVDRRCVGVGWSDGGSGALSYATSGCAGGPCVPADASSGGWPAVLTRMMLAELRLAGGDPRGCLDLLTNGSTVTSPCGVDPGTQVAYQELVTRAALAAGDIAAVAESARRAVTGEAETGPAGVARPRGLVGLALLTRAQLLITEEPAAGAELAAAARTELAAVGLAPAVDRARALARLADGQGGRRAGAPEVRHRSGLARSARLTRRERQVAELVCEGLTNREIAGALVVTEKTVEMHLSHVFAKLGVRNRVRLARHLDATTQSGASPSATPYHADEE